MYLARKVAHSGTTTRPANRKIPGMCFSYKVHILFFLKFLISLLIFYYFFNYSFTFPIEITLSNFHLKELRFHSFNSLCVRSPLEHKTHDKFKHRKEEFYERDYIYFYTFTKIKIKTPFENEVACIP